MADICELTKYTDRHIRRLLPLTFLSPRIVFEVVKDQYSADLTLERLLGCVKLDWRDQVKAIGIAR